MTGKDGYFLAKRQLQESLAYRITRLEEEAKRAGQSGDDRQEVITKGKIYEMEKVLSYVRNVMLWDTDNDRN